MKSPTPKTIRNKLDKLWSKSVLLNYNYTCAYCGRTKETNQIHPHHIYGRRNKSTRWDINNGIALCASHHRRNTKSAHMDPGWFMHWLREWKGDKFVDDLGFKARKK